MKTDTSKLGAGIEHSLTDCPMQRATTYMHEQRRDAWLMHLVNRAILIVVVGLFGFLVGACSKSKPPETEDRQAVFAGLRKQSLTATRATLGLDAPATSTTPWGVVMETGFPEGSSTLVAFSDGSASMGRTAIGFRVPRWLWRRQIGTSASAAIELHMTPGWSRFRSWNPRVGSGASSARLRS
jgi:hypothetical protein